MLEGITHAPIDEWIDDAVELIDSKMPGQHESKAQIEGIIRLCHKFGGVFYDPILGNISCFLRYYPTRQIFDAINEMNLELLNQCDFSTGEMVHVFEQVVQGTLKEYKQWCDECLERVNPWGYTFHKYTSGGLRFHTKRYAGYKNAAYLH